MNYVYGPVPSRRLGFSLGIDIIPYKICTLDCIYCQVGRTTHKVIDRKPFILEENIFKEIRKSLADNPQIDYITFSGSGEPTLNSEIGSLIKKVKEMASIPIAVLTNGTLLFREGVRNDLMEADVVLPSLDAASQNIFKKINKPHHALKIESIIEGLKQFREVYRGQLWLEVMLVKGVNNSGEELLRIKKAISEIKPDKVHLNTVVRPPSEVYAKPMSTSEMIVIKDFLGKRSEIIAEFHEKRIDSPQDLEDSVIEMTMRRPVTTSEIADVFGISVAEAEKITEKLREKGKIKERNYKDKRFFYA